MAKGAYYVQGLSELGSGANQNFISNAGFVITDAGVVVIDALGSPALAQQLLAEIRKLTTQPVKYVIVTHYHADHIYGLQVFKAAGATVVGHALAGEYLASDAAQQRLQISRHDIAPWVDEHTRLVAPDLWVGQPDPLADTTLQVGNTEFVLHSVGPSHTPEDLVVHVPALGVLFAGDLLFRGRLPFVGQADSGGWIRALNRLLALQAKVVVPGHGAASTEPQIDMTLTRDYLQYLRERMGEGARNMDPFDEVYQRTDWSRYSAMPLFEAANRMNAYNTYLLMEREGP
ncbi:MAG: MBL fold metallo-hydrolase [Vitreoscilla sp.]|nr:MBL fold metallo-hydrolase [Vitreoscilla sp.]MBP6676179.1 MBL fold metallo-hydrolase [Vitreoscilla sp.]